MSDDTHYVKRELTIHEIIDLGRRNVGAYVIEQFLHGDDPEFDTRRYLTMVPVENDESPGP